MMTLREAVDALPDSAVTASLRHRRNRTTREARRWSIVNLSITSQNKCKALMNVCAMVRSVPL
jgi:hypothetical protein